MPDQVRDVCVESRDRFCIHAIRNLLIDPIESDSTDHLDLLTDLIAQQGQDVARVITFVLLIVEITTLMVILLLR